MRALVIEEYGPYDSHALKELPDPVPGPGEVVIDARAMSLNFPDYLMIEGRYQHRPKTPFVAGFDVSGIVTAIGPGVTRAAVGERVLAYANHGAFAERACISEEAVWPVPEEMDFPEAAALGLVYLTAHVCMIDRARCRAGETVLITGASGGVGLAMVQYGRALGMRMIGGVTSPEKAELVRRHGAEATVDLAAADLRESLKGEIDALTGGKGVDAVIDMVGDRVFDAAIRTIGWGGRIAIVGFAGGEIPTVRANYLLLKNISVVGAPLGSRRDDTLHERDRAMAALIDCWRSGGIAPVISETLPFADWKTAFSRFARREVTGKIVMVP